MYLFLNYIMSLPLKVNTLNKLLIYNYISINIHFSIILRNIKRSTLM